MHLTRRPEVRLCVWWPRHPDMGSVYHSCPWVSEWPVATDCLPLPLCPRLSPGCVQLSVGFGLWSLRTGVCLVTLSLDTPLSWGLWQCGGLPAWPAGNTSSSPHFYPAHVCPFLPCCLQPLSRGCVGVCTLCLAASHASRVCHTSAGHWPSRLPECVGPLVCITRSLYLGASHLVTPTLWPFPPFLLRRGSLKSPEFSPSSLCSAVTVSVCCFLCI